ncbi:MAG: DUF6339 family protein [bacterium]|nr:DUF6339 family protein [bacterium]
MEIRLLKPGYKNNEQFYLDFLDGTLNDKEEYFSEERVYIEEAPNFPIYMGRGSEEEKRAQFEEAFQVIEKSYIHIDREQMMEEIFWHSLLCTKKRDYILSNYPKVKESYSDFQNIVIKKFDWENYIYKCVLGAQYVEDNVSSDEKEKYYNLILDNLDLYNYIIKYSIFRNDKFLINILSIIGDLELSDILKAKIKGRDDLGADERYGRRVIFEFNKSYPIVMSPMLEKEELQEYFIEYLGYYRDTSDIRKKLVLS